MNTQQKTLHRQNYYANDCHSSCVESIVKTKFNKSNRKFFCN